MFHSKVWRLRGSDTFLNPWIFSKILFEYTARLLKQIKDLSGFSKIFFQRIVFHWNFIAINRGICPLRYFIFSHVKEYAIVGNRIICFPMEMLLIFFGAYFLQQSGTS